MATTRRSTRRALVVGINQYPAPYDLRGCSTHDARRVREVLTARRFTVDSLLDGAATGAGIRTALTRLVTEARAGDVLVFYYSGHGTTLRDASGDERDLHDEAIVPVDFDLLTDDDLREILDRLPAQVGLVTIFDSCFSGTVTRLLGGNVRPDFTARRKYIPGDVVQRSTSKPASKVGGMGFAVQAGEQIRRERLAPIADARAAGFRQTPYVDAASMRHVSLSACLPTEVAYEREVAGEVGGDFTRAACAVLESAGSALEHRGFLARTIERMGPDRAQTPMYDGPPGGDRRTLVTVPR